MEKKLLKLQTENFVLRVNQAKSLSEMILRGGYDWVNEGVNEKNFLSPAEKKLLVVSCRLFNFNEPVNNKKVIKEMKKKGYRPANLFELLALGSQYKWLQEFFPIVALGSSWQLAIDIVKNPYLVADGHGRKVQLNSSHWPPRCYFLGVLVA